MNLINGHRMIKKLFWKINCFILNLKLSSGVKKCNNYFLNQLLTSHQYSKRLLKIHLIKTSLINFYLIRLARNFNVFQNIQKIVILFQIDLKICLNVQRIY